MPPADLAALAFGGQSRGEQLLACIEDFCKLSGQSPGRLLARAMIRHYTREWDIGVAEEGVLTESGACQSKQRGAHILFLLFL